MKAAVPARILIDATTGQTETSWSWRPTWYSGCESIYALLAKFGALNAITVRQVCAVFVKQVARRGRLCFPRIDLRDCTGMPLAQIGRVLSLDVEHVELAFVNQLFPNAAQFSSPHLVWCPECARRGFHSASFQINFIRSCPLHRVELKRACTRCRSPIPYVLASTARVPFFCCWNCGVDHAPQLREPHVHLALDEKSATVFRDHLELLRFTDSLPTLINACRDTMGRPNVPIVLGRPDVFRRTAAYRQFAADVLTTVVRSAGDARQQGLLALAPVSVFRQHFEPPAGARKSASIAEDPTLAEAWGVYRPLRRWIWHHVVHDHRACVRGAQAHLWWDLEGEQTPAFCGVALAFLRWRMQWEGCRVPAQLDNRERSAVPYGLLGWISGEAPIASRLWTRQFADWLNRRLLAYACLDSFRGWLAASLKAERDDTILWRSQDHHQFPRRHWACSGRGSYEEPGLLFIEGIDVPQATLPIGGRAHLAALASDLKRIAR